MYMTKTYPTMIWEWTFMNHVNDSDTVEACSD